MTVRCARHVSFSADVRVWWHPEQKAVYLALVGDKPPVLDWDIELKLCCCGWLSTVSRGCQSRRRRRYPKAWGCPQQVARKKSVFVTLQPQPPKLTIFAAF